MELRDGMFAVKLCELEHQYGLLRSRLELCQGADHEKIRHLLADVLDDYRENALLLEQSAEGCRSPAVAELAGVQRDYSKRMEELLRGRGPAGGAGGGSGPFRGVRHRLRGPGRAQRPAGGPGRHGPTDEL